MVPFMNGGMHLQPTLRKENIYFNVHLSLRVFVVRAIFKDKT